MVRAFVGVLCVWAGITLLQAPTVESQKPGEPSSGLHLARPGQPIAGIPFKEAFEIYKRRGGELQQLPGVVSVSLYAEGIVVETVNPAVLPPVLEGLPIIPLFPADPREAATINDPIATEPLPSPAEPLEEPVAHPPHLAEDDKAVSLERPCASGAERDPVTRECRWISPPPELSEEGVDLLPPPRGVIILKPGKVRESADACPKQFQEIKVANGWRFCVDPLNPEPIPPLMAPPIAGIPFEKAQEIHRRHKGALVNLPGVESVGLGADGIHVRTTNPSILPQEVEGVPVIPLPSIGRRRFLSHTILNEKRPLRGAVAVRDINESAATLTGVVLSQGKPWLIFPAHLLYTCFDSPPCAPGGPQTRLNQCGHYRSTFGAEPIIIQPTSPGSPKVGVATRWTPLDPYIYDAQGNVIHASVPSSDVAAAFMDNDTTGDGDGNGSLSAERRVEVHTTQRPILISGILVPPVVSPTARITMRASGVPKPDGSHEFELRVRETDIIVPQVDGGCVPNTTVALQGQTDYIMVDGYSFALGDSGAPIFDASGNFIGMLNAMAPPPNDHIGSGTDAITIRDTLQFDKLYGVSSVLDQTIGIFRPSIAWWSIDNGNGKWDNACAATPSCDASGVCYEGCFFYGTAGSVNGIPRSIPLTGDWDGNGSITVGVYRTDTNPQQFQLRNSNTSGGADRILNTGTPAFGFLPVVGKWAGVSSATKVGIFKPSDGSWYLDNGNYFVASTGCASGDFCFNTASWTLPGDKPIAGDWDSNGTVTIGVFRPSTSKFYLNNSLPPSGANVVIDAGDPSNGFLPVVANWTGADITGATGTKLGVYKPSTSGWYLVSQLGSPTNCATDHCVGPFGNPEDLPVAFGPSVIRAN